ncbi:uncharacterized protein LOC125576174, partial [Brassica napus]
GKEINADWRVKKGHMADHKWITREY